MSLAYNVEAINSDCWKIRLFTTVHRTLNRALNKADLYILF